MTITILYRGHLSSCDFACPYCPFAKRRETTEQQEKDRQALKRFVRWVRNQQGEMESLQVFFVPWGEALIRTWYREAIVELSHIPFVSKVVAQTNLSRSPKWMDRCDKKSVSLWTTFHPQEMKSERFLKHSNILTGIGIPHSVGVVGVKEHFEAIRTLREQLPPKTYLWINAYKRETDYYSEQDLKFLNWIDPLFHWNLSPHPSFGKSCATGKDVFSVEADGTTYRCFFIKEKLGNIFKNSLDQISRDNPCSKESCHCHIGYVHLAHLNMNSIFGDQILERIPSMKNSL